MLVCKSKNSAIITVIAIIPIFSRGILEKDPRRIFGPKAITMERKTYNEELYNNLHHSPNIRVVRVIKSKYSRRVGPVIRMEKNGKCGFEIYRNISRQA